MIDGHVMKAAKMMPCDRCTSSVNRVICPSHKNDLQMASGLAYPTNMRRDDLVFCISQPSIQTVACVTNPKPVNFQIIHSCGGKSLPFSPTIIPHIYLKIEAHLSSLNQCPSAANSQHSVNTLS